MIIKGVKCNRCNKLTTSIVITKNKEGYLMGEQCCKNCMTNKEKKEYFLRMRKNHA